MRSDLFTCNYKGLVLPNPEATARPNTYMMALVLSYTIDGNTVVVALESELENTQLQFLNRITNSIGEPIVGNITASPGIFGSLVNLQTATLECDYPAFKAKLEKIQGKINSLDQIEDSTKVQSIRYEIETEQFT